MVFSDDYSESVMPAPGLSSLFCAICSMQLRADSMEQYCNVQESLFGVVAPVDRSSPPQGVKEVDIHG